MAVLLDARSQKQRSLTEKRLFGWHAALFPGGYSGFHKIRVARYRGKEEMQIVSGATGREMVPYVAPSKAELDREMTSLLNWLNTELVSFFKYISLDRKEYYSILEAAGKNGMAEMVLTDL